MANITIDTVTYPKFINIFSNDREIDYGYRAKGVRKDTITDVELLPDAQAVGIYRTVQKTIFITVASAVTLDELGNPIYRVVDSVDGIEFTSNQDLKHHLLNNI